MTKRQPQIPKSVRVTCYDVKVSEWDRATSESVDSYGEFNERDLVIRVDMSSRNNIAKVDTLIHEINHAIYFAYGLQDKDKEERIVSTFATAWVQVFRDNPCLVEWLRYNVSV